MDVPVQSAEPENLKMPIGEVIIGFDADARAIRETLDGLGYHGVPVSRSAITAGDIANVDKRR